MKKTFLLSIAALCLCLVTANASITFGDIRVNARFLTDRMAFELHLNTNQYDDLYEINYDFFNSINPYIAEIAIADANAVDAYYHYLDIRNEDLRWVLTSTEYARFITLEYFFRPLYRLNNTCYLRIYKVYPNRSFFYFNPPRHYLTYRGAHCRVHFGGRSYYQRIFPKRYHHPVYTQICHARPSRPARPNPGHPAARPHKDPGYHFTATPHRPEGKPGISGTNKPGRPETVSPGHSVKPGISKPDRHEYIRPHAPQVKPYPKKPQLAKPGNSDRKPSTVKRPNVRKSSPKSQRSVRPEQSSTRKNRTETKRL